MKDAAARAALGRSHLTPRFSRYGDCEPDLVVESPVVDANLKALLDEITAKYDLLKGVRVGSPAYQLIESEIRIKADAFIRAREDHSQYQAASP